MDKTSFAAHNLFGIHGRNALITGATSGIGFMMAEGLIVNGIETLFVTGIENEDVIAKVSLLQALADNNGHSTTILGFISIPVVRVDASIQELFSGNLNVPLDSFRLMFFLPFVL
jgi:NAD(P)-dependent dehydrogenase (short-subunit alcohol dehydrogenase family)